MAEVKTEYTQQPDVLIRLTYSEAEVLGYWINDGCIGLPDVVRDIYNGLHHALANS